MWLECPNKPSPSPPPPPPHLGVWRPHDGAVIREQLRPTEKLLKVFVVGEPLPRHHPPQVRLENSTEKHIFFKHLIQEARLNWSARRVKWISIIKTPMKTVQDGPRMWHRAWLGLQIPQIPVWSSVYRTCCNKFNPRSGCDLDLMWPFFPNLQMFPQDVLEKLCLQEWDGHPGSIMPSSINCGLKVTETEKMN